MTDVLPTLAVTGATGVVGGRVAELLAEAGVAQRLLVRDPDRAPHLPGASVVVITSYGDGEAARHALRGVDTLFMVSGTESPDRVDQHRTFVDAAVRADVGHVVYTSFVSAAPDAVFTFARDHHATEEHIKASGLGWTFLRDNFYLDFMPGFVGDDGVIRGPAADGRCAMVARADVARTAAAVLRDPDAHRGRTYEITGPQALTMTEVAEILSAAEGRPITFHNETVEEAYESRRKYPAADWEYDAWVSTYTAIAAGQMAKVSGDVETVTGTPPMSLAEFLAGR